MKKLIFVFCTLLVFFSCEKNKKPTVSPDADFLFARYACFCASDCIKGYKIAQNKLYEGDADVCSPDSLQFGAAALGADKLTVATALRDALPSEMLTYTEENYGCPGCDDGFAYYVEITDNGGKHHWRIEPDNDNIPADVKIFVQKLEQTLDDLQ